MFDRQTDRQTDGQAERQNSHARPRIPCSAVIKHQQVEFKFKNIQYIQPFLSFSVNSRTSVYIRNLQCMLHVSLSQNCAFDRSPMVHLNEILQYHSFFTFRKVRAAHIPDSVARSMVHRSLTFFLRFLLTGIRIEGKRKKGKRKKRKRKNGKPK